MNQEDYTNISFQLIRCQEVVDQDRYSYVTLRDRETMRPDGTGERSKIGKRRSRSLGSVSSPPAPSPTIRVEVIHTLSFHTGLFTVTSRSKVEFFRDLILQKRCSLTFFQDRETVQDQRVRHN